MGKPGSSGGVNYMVGFNQLITNMNAALAGMEAKSVRGMILAAALIRHQTEHKQPKTPRKYGNLIASWMVVTAERIHTGKGTARFNGPNSEKIMADHQTALADAQAEAKSLTTDNKKFVIFGYGVNYAGFLHEMIGADASNFTRKGSNVKWLETHIKANASTMLKLIGTTIKGKP